MSSADEHPNGIEVRAKLSGSEWAKLIGALLGLQLTVIGSGFVGWLQHDRLLTRLVASVERLEKEEAGK